MNFGQCLAGFWLGVRIEVFQRLRKEKGDFLRQMYQGSGSRDISVFSYLTIQKVYLKTKVIHKTRVIVPISEKPDIHQNGIFQESPILSGEC